MRPDVWLICEAIKSSFVTTPPSLILEILVDFHHPERPQHQIQFFTKPMGCVAIAQQTSEKRLAIFFVFIQNTYQQVPDLATFSLSSACKVECFVQDLFV